ncbi:MAG TPA: 6-bladed beta-propeller [Puia sp.]|nr:6-bladed beta-propeller [Puia sp.]
MLKNILILVLTLSNFFLFGQSVINLRVDPENARGGTASQVFSDVKFIPLETTKESLFGQIDQMEVTDSFFIVLDQQSRSILVFTREGKLHKRIKSPGPEKYFNYFALDRVAREIIASNNYADGLLIYNYDGLFLRKEPCPEHVQSLFYLGNRSFVYNIERISQAVPSNKSSYDLALSTGYNSITKYLNPYNPKCEDGEFNMMSNPINFSGVPGSCMFSLPFSYSVYQLNDTGVLCRYNFILPLKYSLPSGFDTGCSFANKRAEYVYHDPENIDKINSIGRVFRSGDYILFTAISSHFKIGSDWNYAYNTRSGNLISFSKVTPDSSSSHLPILASVFENINAIDGNNIFASCPSFRLLSFKGISDRPIVYPDALKELFSTGNKTSNPIIILVQLK